MKPRVASLWLGTCALAAVLAAGLASGAPTPERIVSLRMRSLPHQRYAELCDEWRAYTRAHPRDPLGWCELAKASRYAGVPCDTFVRYAERAIRLAPDDALANATLGENRWSLRCPGQPDDPSESARLLERALKLDPGLDGPRYSLWVIRLSQGRPQEAAAQLTSLLERGLMPDPLVDMGYNMLVAVEPNAIILTNGDNDTYPPLALQAARGTRTDVAIVNLSLLNTEWYRRGLRDGPLAVPVPVELKETEDFPALDAVHGLIENLDRAGWKQPLYISVTVDLKSYPMANKLSMEGVVYRVLPASGGGVEIDRERLAQNLGGRYRLESATSLAVDWKAWAGVGRLVCNYASARGHLATALAAAGDRAGARAQMERALDLCRFHHASSLGRELLEEWERWDTGSDELARWRKELGSQGWEEVGPRD